VTTGFFLASRYPITLTVTACGHEPKPRSRSLRTTVTAPVSPASISLMEPSSAPSSAELFCTTDSRMGVSSVVEATTPPSSESRRSAAASSLGSAGGAAIPGTSVMIGSNRGVGKTDPL
jgi:hypothetical protein